MTDDLATRLDSTWRSQAESGFLLSDPGAPVETRRALDPVTGVTYRFRWLPHRELRNDAAELTRRGILDGACDPASLYRDPRDPSGRYCFLCPANLRRAFPGEVLVPVTAGGVDWSAGANFAWMAADHFTVMTNDHVDQAYDRGVLDAMIDIHRQTRGRFRVIYNGDGAGASIPWHRHLHVIGESLPIEEMVPGSEAGYPLPLHRFEATEGGPAAADRVIRTWLERDPLHHRVNLLVAGPHSAPVAFVVERDARRPTAARKGLMGGFEAAGDFVYSEPGLRSDFERADLETATRLLTEIRPPASDPPPGAERHAG